MPPQICGTGWNEINLDLIRNQFWVTRNTIFFTNCNKIMQQKFSPLYTARKSKKKQKIKGGLSQSQGDF
jgi:hypothetical protein